MNTDRQDSLERSAASLLADLEAGREGAEEAILPRIYEELRALAHRQMRAERRDHTLQTTALVHEAYLRLGGIEQAHFESRAHFLRVAARAMRQILVDYARRRQSEGQGGTWKRVPLDSITEALGEASGDILSLDMLLEKLSALDDRLARVVELRFFAGLSVQDTARILGVSKSTIKTDWTFAKAWLKERIA